MLQLNSVYIINNSYTQPGKITVETIDMNLVHGFKITTRFGKVKGNHSIRRPYTSKLDMCRTNKISYAATT